jgi:hypothetical protein
MSGAPQAGRGTRRGPAVAAGRQHPEPARCRQCLLAVAVGLIVLVAAAGCTGPVRSDDVYASKAAATARAEASAVQTALLVVRQAGERRLFGRALAQALAEAASDGGDVQATFDAIQPPDHRADLLRSQLDELLDPAVSALTDLRTAARRGDLAALPRLAAPLHGLGDKLDRFQQAHQ